MRWWSQWQLHSSSAEVLGPAACRMLAPGNAVVGRVTIRLAVEGCPSGDTAVPITTTERGTLRAARKVTSENAQLKVGRTQERWTPFQVGSPRQFGLSVASQRQHDSSSTQGDVIVRREHAQCSGRSYEARSPAAQGTTPAYSPVAHLERSGRSMLV